MKLKTLTSMSVLGSLLGCSTLFPVQQGPAPVAVVRNNIPSQVHATPKLKTSTQLADGLYVLARQSHANGDLGSAAQGYERVLTLLPDHSGALNALGVIRAQDGRTEEALDLFARALKTDPAASHVHNNLGYTLLRAERLEEAQASLKLALELQPESAQTLKNLELLAQAKEEKAKTEATVAEGRGPASQPLADVQKGPAIVSVAPNVFELRMSTSLASAPATDEPKAVQAAVASPAAVPAVEEVARIEPAEQGAAGFKLVLSREIALERGPFAIWTDIRGVKLEVSNGVGVERLAKRTAVRLAQSGVATARLTNDRPYRQERTQIEYLPGQQLAVKALAAQLPVPVDLVEVEKLHPRVHLRLVLGHDVAGQAIAAWIDDASATRVAAKPAEAGQSAS